MNCEINLSDLLTLITTVVGAIIIYFSITRSSHKLRITESNLSLAKELKNLVPMVANNYTNELTEDKKSLEVKVYLRFKSELPTEMSPPTLEIIDEQGKKISPSLYEATNLSQTQGLFSPGSIYKITYKIKIFEGFDPVKCKVSLCFKFNLSSILRVSYWEIYKTSRLDKETYDNLTSLKVTYSEKIHPFEKNDNWDDFWNNPR